MTIKQLSTDEIVAQALGGMPNGALAAVLKTLEDEGQRRLPFEPAPSTTHEVVLVGANGDTTCWLPGTLTPAHDGEYEVLHPVTGLVERAAYDTLFEAWSCEWQYPTWRGCTEQVT